MELERYRDALLALLPPGDAFPRDRDTLLAALCEALGLTAVGVDVRAAELLGEADPRAAVELFDEWLKSVGLPDPDYPGPISTDILRRQLISRLTVGDGQSIRAYIARAALLGYEVTIERNRVFVTGPAECGEAEAQTADQAYVWYVTSTATSDFLSECGQAVSGVDACGGETGNELLEYEFNRAAQSHSLPVYLYP